MTTKKNKPIKLLENDGHNFPLIHVFRDWDQAAKYTGFEGEELEMLMGGDMVVDKNFVTWYHVENKGIHKFDHTKD